MKNKKTPYRLGLIFWIGFLIGCPAFLLAQEPTSKAVVVKAKAAEKLGVTRYAVIIGVNTYQNTQIPSLKFAESDARAVYETLTDPQVGGIASGNAKLLLGSEATACNVRKAINALRTISKDATVFIFFSGHGTKEAGDAFWVTYDAELGDMASTAISDRDVREMMGRIPSDRLIMFLDCCYAAATVRGQKSVIDDQDFMQRFAGKGRVTITASGSEEEAIEALDLKQGVFAHYLVEGLTGQADGVDGPADGVVTVPELTAYIDKTVADAARQRKGIQKPVISMEEVQEPTKFLVTINADCLMKIEMEQRLQLQKVQVRLVGLRQMFIDEKINAEQYLLGKALLGQDPNKLNEFDRQRLDIFIELTDGKLPSKRSQALMDSIETLVLRVEKVEEIRKLSKENSSHKFSEGYVEMSPDDVSAERFGAYLGTSIGSPKWISVDCGKGIMLEMVLIGPGSLLEGDSEGKLKTSMYSPFYMGKFEVTQAQYEVVTGMKFKGDAAQPVVVRLIDAENFCRKLSEKTGKMITLPAKGQWKFACQREIVFRYVGTNEELAREVAADCLKPNRWGVYDMHPKQEEWYLDWLWPGTPMKRTLFLKYNSDVVAEFRVVYTLEWE